MRLRSIKDERTKLDDEEKMLSNPALSDYDDIPKIFDYCHEAYEQLHPRTRVRASEIRRKYLFVILFLYSPKTLAGGKMSSGLRTKIAEALGVEPTNISHYHSDIWFYYTVYSDFREDVNQLFSIVFENLKRGDMLKNK